jgi:hypothetical protein
MPTPFRPVWWELGSLHAGTRAIHGHDWSGLLRVSKRGQNRVVPGQHGSIVRPRYKAELRAALPLRIDGRWTDDSLPRAGGPDDWAAAAETLYADVLAAVKVDVPQTLTLHLRSGPVTADCLVEEATVPSWPSPWRASLRLDVTLPDGPLDLTPAAP